MTGFSNTEEAAVGLAKVVPFLVEDSLKQNGGKYSKAEDWKPYVVSDDNLITGQNPASSEAAAKAVLEQLRSPSACPKNAAEPHRICRRSPQSEAENNR